MLFAARGSPPLWAQLIQNGNEKKTKKRKPRKNAEEAKWVGHIIIKDPQPFCPHHHMTQGAASPSSCDDVDDQDDDYWFDRGMEVMAKQRGGMK